MELVRWLIRAELRALRCPVWLLARRSGLTRATICCLLAGRVDCITDAVDAGLARLLCTPAGWWLWLGGDRE